MNGIISAVQISLASKVVSLDEVALTLPSSSPGGEGGPRNHYDASNWVIRARAIDRKRPSSGGEHY